MATLIGTALDDILDGTADNDIVDGGGDPFGIGGNDILRGFAGNDFLQGGSGDDILEGGPGADVLLGGFGVNADPQRGFDVLVGGDGNDVLIEGRVMLGQGGDDTYDLFFDRPGVRAIIAENPGEGTDTVQDYRDIVLGDNFENALLYNFHPASDAQLPANSVGNINTPLPSSITGNELANVLTGNDAGNVLTGLGGNDTINGDQDGNGVDTAVFSGDVTAYSFHKFFNAPINEDSITVTGPDGVDTLTRVELSSFTGPGFYNRFDPINYLNQNPDIANAGIDPLSHYLAHGADEGRAANSHVNMATFNGEEYIASYPDLIVGYGDNPAAGFEHFQHHGVFEGRVQDNFDAAQYLANYADLQAAFGTDLHAATEHFVNFGFFEHRTDHA